jgi:hypothetical protein
MTENWRLKLAALALALLLWAVVTAEQPSSQWIPVRVEPVLEDPAYVLTGGADPAEVRVRFTGPGRELWQLAVDPPTLVLRLREVGSARSFTVDPSMVRTRERLEVEARDVRPAVVRVHLQRLASRVVPVRARIGARSLRRWVLSDSVRVSPSTVRVMGPEDVLARIEAVETRSFEIVPGDDDSTFANPVRLDVEGLGEGVSLSAPEVRVSGGVDRREDLAFPGVAVWTPEGMRSAPVQVEVHAQGGRRALAGVTAAALRAVVPRDSLPAALPAAGVEAPVVVEGLPPGVAARTVPLRVRVAPAAPPAPPGAPRLP